MRWVEDSRKDPSGRWMRVCVSVTPDWRLNVTVLDSTVPSGRVIVVCVNDYCVQRVDKRKG